MITVASVFRIFWRHISSKDHKKSKNFQSFCHKKLLASRFWI